ncbi:MAG TPA: group 1 truncated hemoglobin [Polyangiaceae bacterium]|nr:group 1 truncated hemoglobin [Polyangiaceae bacterium]
MATLFQRLGGESAIMATVGLFYEKVLADERTKAFFDGLPMDAQVQKQMAFMAWAFGGPREYQGRDLREAHAKLVKRGLGDAEFDVVVSHLEATLRELNVAGDLIAEVLAIVEGTRNHVLGRGP